MSGSPTGSPQKATKTAVKDGFDADEAIRSLAEDSEIVRRTIAELRKARGVGARVMHVRFQG